MGPPIFQIKEHVVESQHIREYPRATAQSQEDILHLAVKQYVPLDNPNPQEGDITIIGAHANGFPKVWAQSEFQNIPCTNKTRNYTKPCGRIYMLVRKRLASELEGSGLPMSYSKGPAECLMKVS